MFQERAKALGCLCAGFVSSGISCSLYVSCGLGSDAFNVMTQGLSDTLGIQTGNAFYVIQGAMLLLVLALRRAQDIAFIMVAVDIQHRHGGHRCQIFQIMAVQIAAGNDQINARELVRCEIVPQGFAFLVGDS